MASGGQTMKILPFTDAEKQAQMLHLLKLGTVMVFLDARREGVRVPEHFAKDFQLRLNFDYAFEIDDFRVLPNCIEATLSFNQNQFFCVVPLSAVYLMVSHGSQVGSLYPESVPHEMLNFFTAESRDEKRPSKLAAIAPAPAASSAKSSDEAPPPAPKPRKRGHLRVVK
jgi:stringent starvation protein B